MPKNENLICCANTLRLLVAWSAACLLAACGGGGGGGGGGGTDATNVTIGGTKTLTIEAAAVNGNTLGNGIDSQKTSGTSPRTLASRT